MDDKAFGCLRRKALQYVWLTLSFTCLLVAFFDWWKYQQYFQWFDLALMGVLVLSGFAFFYRFYWESHSYLAILYPDFIDLYIKMGRAPLRVYYEKIQKIELIKNRKIKILIQEEKSKQKVLNLSMYQMEYPEDFWIALNKEVQKKKDSKDK